MAKPAEESAASLPSQAASGKRASGKATSGTPAAEAKITSAPSRYQFSLRELSGHGLNNAIRTVPISDDDEALTEVNLTDAAGQPNQLMNLDHAVRIEVEGPLGDYACALNSQSDIRISGAAGNGVAEGMVSGKVRVRGNAGAGSGAAMAGGTLAIYGSAGDRCGAGMCGGGIFVRGDVGDEAGVGALRGTIVIGGDSGKNLGDAMSNATVFIRGRAGSLAQGVAEAPLRNRELLRLGLLLINASIRGEAKEFRRIVPIAILRAEQSLQGEINPHWR
ncbi:MAG: tributyrin esterase [Rubripirellula sp.]|nr:tributyrin esterase [Rubripirellula sp.]